MVEVKGRKTRTDRVGGGDGERGSRGKLDRVTEEMESGQIRKQLGTVAGGAGGGLNNVASQNKLPAPNITPQPLPNPTSPPSSSHPQLTRQ